MSRAAVKGTGFAVPEKVLTNADLERIVDTSDEWITTRTGIKERRIADDATATSDLVLRACEGALERASISADEVDCIVVGTVTPDTPFPSTACWVQKGLGIPGVIAFDVSAACSGFLYGLTVGDAMIRTGRARTVLVSGAETLTKITNWDDRGTCVLFGDGAGAVVLREADGEEGLLSCYLGADGSLGELLIQPAGGSRRPASEQTVKDNLHTVHMMGNEVFKHAVKAMQMSALKALKMAGLTAEDVSLFIPHQANIRIIEATCKRARIPMDKTMVTIHKYGNVSAGTIPIALAEADREGRLKEGDIVLLAAFGGGFTWGAAVLRW
jgi:3-oxoacyl-[acyl-carrier-protein] synthase-3